MSHLQNIFNKAYQHFVIDQNPPAAEVIGGGTAMCSYFDERTNRKCAIGLSFDNETCELFNNGGSFGDIVLEVEPEKELQKHTRMFEEIKQEIQSIFNLDEEKDIDLIQTYLDDFQSELHDDLISGNTGDWVSHNTLKNSYIQVAEKYNLTVPS